MKKKGANLSSKIIDQLLREEIQVWQRSTRNRCMRANFSQRIIQESGTEIYGFGGKKSAHLCPVL